MHETTAPQILFALAILLASAKTLGHFAQRLNQPAVVGELLAGVLLGPTIAGRVVPDLQLTLFGTSGATAQTLAALNQLGIVLFLFMAGAEIDAAGVGRRVKQALSVGLGGMILPMLLGATTAYLAPGFLGWEGLAERWVFALFIGTALCISALPVIAKTLMDLGIYRSDLGMTVVAAAVLNDVGGWILFAIILSAIRGGPDGVDSLGFLGPVAVIGMGAALWLLGRPIVHRLLALVQRMGTSSSASLAVMMPLALAGAAISERLGLHAMLGAFVVGTTTAGSEHFRERTRAALSDFVAVLFAPLFFASIGLGVDFVADFDVRVVLFLVVVATVGKVVGCGLAARMSRIPKRESIAIGFAMNARGAMEVVLAMVARDAGLVSGRTFVALVVMAIATSMVSGPVLRRLLLQPTRLRLVDCLDARCFQAPLAARTAEEAIRELCKAAGAVTGLDPNTLSAAVVARERLMSTALERGVAAPHAAIEGIARPLVAIGISKQGLEFDAADGQPVRLVVLLLTAPSVPSAQLELLADLARVFSAPASVDAMVEAKSHAAARRVLSVPLSPTSAAELSTTPVS